MCPPLALHLASPWPRRREPQCHCRDKVNNVFACRWCIRARAPGAGWLCCVLRHGQYPPREATGGRDAPRGYDLLFVAAAGGCTLTLVLKLVLGRQTATARVRRGGIFPRCVSTRATDLTQHGPSRRATLRTALTGRGGDLKAPPTRSLLPSTRPAHVKNGCMLRTFRLVDLKRSTTFPKCNACVGTIIATLARSRRS